jgi:acyl-CoA synthetase (AMP-forming)/AMP-acid ligase II
MLAWNYANIWESIAAAQPGQPTVVQGDDVWSAARLDAHADALASIFLSAGLIHQSKVAVYLYNCPQFIATYLAAFKAALVPVNTNFRYGPSELLYLLDNADAEAVVFDANFAPQLESIRLRLPKVKLWLVVGAASASAAPSWAERYEQRVSEHPDARGVQAPWGRTGDDLLLLYTGGTTGVPKGVMWRQEDLVGAGNFGANPISNVPPMSSPETAGLRAQTLERPVSMIPCPLMHGTGLLGAFSTLGSGGTVVLLAGTGFDAEALWTQVDRWRVSRVAIVGQPFAAPMLEALERDPQRWELSSLRAIVSSGAMWSQENKRALHHHLPNVLLADGFSSSEAMSMGYSLSGAGTESATAHFHVGEHCAVFNDAGERVKPGSGERGRVAVTGHIPLGYYKDPIKSAQTFPTLEGRRWSMPGDYAELNQDGTLTLIGRGSQCINTGGEKVYPEEVEEVLKRHQSVRDVAVVGVPDERYGERICAIVQLRASVAPVSESALIAHAKAELAAYKAPRHVFFVDEVYRAPNGKLDYPAAKKLARERYDASVH